MRPPLRQVLADSHVAAVAIALFLLWSLDAAFSAVWPPISHVLEYAFTAIAILDIPYFSHSFTVADRSMLILSLVYLYSCLVSFAAAWVLSRWIYGMGPLAALISLRRKLIRGEHA
ncbi:MAG TPA: hypothetical protein VMT05_09865 [Terriglobales bacterium]|jgi:hypothetical protein|nr:hypothetical protein [Terriglobales bacterium]